VIWLTVGRKSCEWTGVDPVDGSGLSGLSGGEVGAVRGGGSRTRTTTIGRLGRLFAEAGGAAVDQEHG
jgi:hypothetical protein